ncbi:unnamed protein product [Cunninghamella blakesleeana]
MSKNQHVQRKLPSSGSSGSINFNSSAPSSPIGSPSFGINNLPSSPTTTQFGSTNSTQPFVFGNAGSVPSSPVFQFQGF